MTAKQVGKDLVRITGEKIASSASNSVGSIKSELSERLGIDTLEQVSKGRFLGNQLGKMALRYVGLDAYSRNFNLGDLFSSYKKELRELKAQREKAKQNKENGVSTIESAVNRLEGVTDEQRKSILETINSKFNNLETKIESKQPPELKRAGKTIETEQLQFFEDSQKSQKEIKHEIQKSAVAAETKVVKVITVEDKILSENRKQTDLLERISSQMGIKAPAEIKEGGEKGDADKLFDFGLDLFGRKRRGRGRFPRLPKLGGLGKIGKLARFAKGIPVVGAAAAIGFGLKDAYDGFNDENATKLFGKSNLLTKTGAGAANALSGLSFGLVSQETIATVMKWALTPITQVSKFVGKTFDKAKVVIGTLGDGFDNLFEWFSGLPIVGPLFKKAKTAVGAGANFLQSGWSSAFAGASNLVNNTANSLGMGNVVSPKIGGSSYSTGTSSTPVQGGKQQSGVLAAFKNAGFSENQAIALTAEVGRENDYGTKALYGSHTDPAADAAGGRITNYGMLSWNKGRGEKLLKFMSARGLVDKNGRFPQTQESLNAQAEFVRQEINGQYSDKLQYFLNNPNADPETFAKELGRNYVGWAYGQETIRAKGGGRQAFPWKVHDAKRRNYKAGAQQIAAAQAKANAQATAQTGQTVKSTAKPVAPPAVTVKQPTKPEIPAGWKAPMALPSQPNVTASAPQNIAPSQNSLGILPMSTSDTIDDVSLHLFVKGLMA